MRSQLRSSSQPGSPTTEAPGAAVGKTTLTSQLPVVPAAPQGLTASDAFETELDAMTRHWPPANELLQEIKGQLGLLQHCYRTPLQAIAKARALVATVPAAPDLDDLTAIADEVAVLQESPEAQQNLQEEEQARQAWRDQREQRTTTTTTSTAPEKITADLSGSIILAGGFPYNKGGLDHIRAAHAVNPKVVVVDLHAGPVAAEYQAALDQEGIRVTWLLGTSLAALGGAAGSKLLLPHPDEGWRQQSLAADLAGVVGGGATAYLLIDGERDPMEGGTGAKLVRAGLGVHCEPVVGTADLGGVPIAPNSSKYQGPYHKLVVR